MSINKNFIKIMPENSWGTKGRALIKILPRPQERPAATGLPSDDTIQKLIPVTVILQTQYGLLAASQRQI